MSRTIFVDWGTTSFRAYLVGRDGVVQAARASDQGVKASAGRFEDILRSQIQPWLQDGGVARILCAGMVGSDLGWRNVAMIPCPAEIGALASSLCAQRAPGWPATLIVPGLSSVESDGAIGMMRGEEVLLFGALALLGAADGRFCFPGTHSKWVTVKDAAAQSIRTCMTGECFALMRTQSVLSGSLSEWSGEICEADFMSGVATAHTVRNPLQSAFSVRAAHVHGRLPSVAARASYLSGVFIGAEVAGFAADWPGTDRRLTIACEPRLAGLYQLACASFAIETVLLDEENCFVAGGMSILNEHGALTDRRAIA